MKKKKVCGFSLAEALITLLIVCLITIASIPVLTKKRRQATTPRGSWVCTLNSNGEHVYYSSITGVWKKSGNDCKFYPPREARNFEVIAVGGGGGGASGYKENDTKRAFGDGSKRVDFRAPADGEYEVTVVGGGGQGGRRKNNANRCKENPGGPGGSGGFVNKKVTISKGTNCVLYAGSGGSNGDKDGAAGETSYFSYGSSKVSATGGGGGSKRWGPACGKGASDPVDSNWGRRGAAGSPGGLEGDIQKDPSDNNHVRTTGGAFCKTFNREDEADLKNYSVSGINCNTLLTEFRYLNGASSHNLRAGNGYMAFENVHCFPYGYGGAGHDSSGDREPSGGPGLVMVYYNLIYSGEGGDAATPLRPPVYPQIKKLVAKIGAGGKGATTSNSAGRAGSSTTYTVQTRDSEFTKTTSGASGGSAQMSHRASADSTGYIAGGTGETSEVKPFRSNAVGGLGGFDSGNTSDVNGKGVPFQDGSYYGAGGGGGGANDTSWGVGGDGAPGAVIIYW